MVPFSLTDLRLRAQTWPQSGHQRESDLSARSKLCFISWLALVVIKLCHHLLNTNAYTF